MLKLKQVQDFKIFNRIEKYGNRISFCVYGDKLKYIVGAIHNIILAKEIYPDWICRFYIEEKTQLKTLLKDMNTEVFTTSANFNFGQIHPVTWRFLALNDELIDRVIFRDVDSRVNFREQVAVNEWIKSGKAFHRMKEIPHINDPPILSGMWGAKADKLRNINSLLSSYNDWKDPLKPLPADFIFLEKKVWTIMKEDCLYHGVKDDKYGIAIPFPEHKKVDYGFVGARVIDDKWGM